MKFGEIFICRFPFTSGQASKPRPALVLFDIGLDVVICRITSVQHSDPLDVTVADWSAAALAKPSVIRLSRIVTAEKALLRTRIGELTAADKDAVRKIWNANMMLYPPPGCVLASRPAARRLQPNRRLTVDPQTITAPTRLPLASSPPGTSRPFARFSTGPRCLPCLRAGR